MESEHLFAAVAFACIVCWLVGYIVGHARGHKAGWADGYEECADFNDEVCADNLVTYRQVLQGKEDQIGILLRRIAKANYVLMSPLASPLEQPEDEIKADPPGGS